MGIVGGREGKEDLYESDNDLEESAICVVYRQTYISLVGIST